MKSHKLNRQKTFFSVQLLLFFSLFFAPDLSATQYGKVIGRVLDAKTKAPIENANVTIIDTKLGDATDAQGKFYINRVPVGLKRIKVEFVGYSPSLKTDILVSTGKRAFLEFEITEKSFELEEAVFTAGYFPEEEKTPTSTVSLSAEEIRRYPGGFEDVVRTVSTLPGIAVNSSGGRNDLLVRGGGPSENLYLINDIEVANINHFSSQGSSSGSLSFVNLEFVEDVTFSTGGFSAEFGDKMSSALSLKMQNKFVDKIETKINVSATQYGLNFKSPLTEDGNIIFSARKSYLDLIFKAADLPFVPVYTDFNLFANYNLTPHDKIFMMGLFAIDNIERDQSSQENRVKNSVLLDNTQYISIGGINYRKLISGGYLDLILSNNLYQYEFEQVDDQEVPYFNSDSDENEVNAKLNLYKKLTGKLGVKSGLSLKKIYTDSKTTFADSIYDQNGNKISVADLGLTQDLSVNSSSYKYAFFSDVDYLLNSKWYFKLGARLDYYDFLTNKLSFSPRGSVKYNINSVLSAKISGGVYHQSPSTVWMTNKENQRLKPLKNYMGVLGLNYLLAEDLKITLESYYKKYSDLPSGTLAGVNDYIVITNTGIGFGGREDNFQSFGYTNLNSEGSARSYGGDLSIQKKNSDIPLYGITSLSYSRTLVTPNNDREYPSQYDQRFIFNLSAGYILNPKWEFALKFRYFSGIPFTPVYKPSENPINPGTIKNLPDEYLSDRLAAGHHLDIRIDRTFNFKSSTLIAYLDIQNLYNYKIPERPRYNFWDDEIQNSSRIGILPSIGLSYEF